MSTSGQPDKGDVGDQFAKQDRHDEPDADKSAQELILEDSLERTEHPEETGAASSQTIPEII